jgi:hypothetical protein
MTFIDPASVVEPNPPPPPAVRARMGVDIRTPSGPASPTGAPGAQGTKETGSAGLTPQSGNADWTSVVDFTPPASQITPSSGPSIGSSPSTSPNAGWNAVVDFSPPPAKQPIEVGTGEAALKGAANAASFGFAPAISGLAEASGVEAPNMGEDVGVPEAAKRAATFVGRPFLGAVKMLHEAVAGTNNPEVLAAYERGRKAALEEQNAAEEQHPYAYIAGQLGGAVLGPAFGAMGGASAAARILRGAAGGGVAGTIGGAGETVSRGDTSAGGIATGAAKGGAAGAIAGGAGAGAAELIGRGVGAVRNMIRGKQAPEDVATGRVAGALSEDYRNQGAPFTPEEIRVARDAGVPLTNADLGGEQARKLVRSASNTSPEARHAMAESFIGRFETRNPRVGNFIRTITGTNRGSAGEDLIRLQDAARKANKPAYARAYAKGSRGIWSPELERLAGAEAVANAARGAGRNANDVAIAEGVGAFNPKVTVKNGLVQVSRKGGVPTHPDLQFWDYVQREMRDAAEKAKGPLGKETNRSRTIENLRRQLNAELDKQVPEFKAARQGAAGFFGAEDALDAGRKFVTQEFSDVTGVRRALAKMSRPERALFARGFASQLADKVEKVGLKNVGLRLSTINSIFETSPQAAQKITLALGPHNTRELEVLLRVEAIADQARVAAFGNSTTVRQAHEAGAAGGHAVAGVEALKEVTTDPAGFIAALFGYKALKGAAERIDERVARHVGELLASGNFSQVRQGIRLVASNPKLFAALRRSTQVGARVSAADLGLGGVIGVGEAGLSAARGLVGHGAEREDHKHENREDLVP